MEAQQKAGLSDYLAAERTFLAWIRTGLALMGFGFVVARFGLFLQEFRITRNIPAQASYGLSAWFGIALVALGVAVTVFSGWRHARLIRGLNRGETGHVTSLAQAVAIALFLTVFGLAMVIYLVSLRAR